MYIDEECNCNPGELMLFPCAGACNVGQLANDLTKEMTNRGIGKMACIAAVGGGGMMAINAAKGAKVILVVDGCPVGCARKILERNGIAPTLQVIVTDIGMKKTDTLSYSKEEMDKMFEYTLEKLRSVK
ncbi:MAG: putative zinc-binding protein [Methanomassiliicoccales archaeon]|nr:MAG: putative zinc-binding protein [Methanomassiliicoccales archaeon]